MHAPGAGLPDRAAATHDFILGLAQVVGQQVGYSRFVIYDKDGGLHKERIAWIYGKCMSERCLNAHPVILMSPDVFAEN